MRAVRTVAAFKPHDRKCSARLHYFFLMIESLYCFLIIVILLSFYNMQTLGDDDWCSGVCRLACWDGGVGDLLVRIWIVRRARLWSRSAKMGDGIERDIGYG